jgi:acyl-CoA synthetase (AMP-forming)/AMP-acid ligase II
VLLGDAVEFGARKFADRPAIVFEDEITTFASLRDRVNRLSNGLLQLTSPGERVAILSENRPQFIEAYAGVPMAGMALTFLNYRLNPKELAQIVTYAEATVLLIEPKYLPQMLAVRAEMETVRTIVTFGAEPAGADALYEEVLAEGSTERPQLDVSEHDLAWLIYTSGTTGRPKGAMLSHRNLLRSLFSWLVAQSPKPGGVNFMPFPLCHVAGYGIPGYWLQGTTLVLRPAYEPEDFMRQVQRYRITTTPMAPTMLNMLLQHPAIDQYDLSSITGIAYGGSSMPVEVLKRAMARFQGVEFIQGFGMTELSGNVLFFDAPSHLRAAADRPDLLAAAGRPMALSSLRVVDDDMNDVAAGEVGEIVVQGDQVMQGYWRNPAATEEAFAGGWFHTGDLARFDDEGFHYIVDRKKDMIITGGENVYSRQVEDVIYQHPGVVEVAVIGLPDEHWGENVCAVVVLEPGASASANEIIQICRDNLAGYKKPKRVEFVDALPKNASGKVLKRELRAQFS